MGVWGTGIYSNDTAEEVRDACRDIFAYYDIEEGNQKLFSHFREIVEQEWVDDDYASFWYALSDWQWKHGMLTDFVKEKTLLLLERYAGIEEWQETGNCRDVLKRKTVLDALQKQLETQQPPLKKPKLSLAKPRHKVGEIIVFRAATGSSSIWKKNTFTPPFMFKSDVIAQSEYEDVCGYDAQGRYMALLCVGTEKELHSEYLPDVYDIRSVYVWYDYLSEEEPSIDELKTCGFLPFIDLEWEDFNRCILGSAEWVYKFTLCSENFRRRDELMITQIYKTVGEVPRFNELFSWKNYSSKIWGGFSLYDMFVTAFEEKNRMEILGEKIDNLLQEGVVNPELLSSFELQKSYEKFINTQMKG